LLSHKKAAFYYEAFERAAGIHPMSFLIMMIVRMIVSATARFLAVFVAVIIDVDSRSRVRVLKIDMSLGSV
jgi:hypothetical protein